MKIGELARITGMRVETIRFYEQQKLLPEPPRSESNYRHYSPAHVDRLRFIRNCRSLDMTHEEIRTLLAFRDAPDPSCAGVNRLLDDHIGHVAERIAELGSLQAELVRLRRCCDGPLSGADCGIMQSLGREESAAAPKGQPHGGLSRTHDH